ncbi:hypothetical protein ARMGADRAFT_778877 [Armillaria gallica]|uniref:Uncharacterized protein n=1 Tax=Armillaria gallica TaxID=47427 RepID=A0A2H3CQL4_ARMGA|nr:hypothetical protein ARMGADRAFT_778877 [Armillaria gallica]
MTWWVVRKNTGHAVPMSWNRWMVIYCQQSHVSALQGRKLPNDGKTITASHLCSGRGTGTAKTRGFHVNAQDFLLFILCAEAPTGWYVHPASGIWIPANCVDGAVETFYAEFGQSVLGAVCDYLLATCPSFAYEWVRSGGLRRRALKRARFENRHDSQRPQGFSIKYRLFLHGSGRENRRPTCAVTSGSQSTE